MTSATLAERKPAAVLETFLRPSLYIPELKSRKKNAVLDEVAHALEAAGVTRHPSAVAEALRQRESLGSTGIGKGVAIPHTRSTLVGERTVLVARSSKGVDFDAVDENPVRLLFLIAAPPIERDPIYLKLLAEIVRAVRLVKVRQRILDAPDFDTIREVLANAAAD
jgi:fructose-specific phosphotransferase system IIA component